MYLFLVFRLYRLFHTYRIHNRTKSISSIQILIRMECEKKHYVFSVFHYLWFLPTTTKQWRHQILYRLWIDRFFEVRFEYSVSIVYIYTIFDWISFCHGILRSPEQNETFSVIFRLEKWIVSFNHKCTWPIASYIFQLFVASFK